MKPKKYKFTIGIDAGKQTGVAAWDDDKKQIVFAVSTDFLGAIEFVKSRDKSNTKVVVEIPAAFVYDKHNDRQGKTRDKMNHNIGGNSREAQLLADSIEKLGYVVRRVPPIREEKWTAKQLKMILKFYGRTNQHVRDAARLAFYFSGGTIS